jgi:hypothetical protein
LKGLSLRLADGSGAPADAFGRTFVFPENDRKLETLTLERAENDRILGTLKIRINGSEHRIDVGKGRWQNGKAAWGRLPPQPVACCGAWTSDGQLTTKLCFVETPFTHTITLKFSEKDVEVATESNVGFGPTTSPALVGQSK